MIIQNEIIKKFTEHKLFEELFKILLLQQYNKIIFKNRHTKLIPPDLWFRMKPIIFIFCKIKLCCFWHLNSNTYPEFSVYKFRKFVDTCVRVYVLCISIIELEWNMCFFCYFHHTNNNCFQTYPTVITSLHILHETDFCTILFL